MKVENDTLGFSAEARAGEANFVCCGRLRRHFVEQIRATHPKGEHASFFELASELDRLEQPVYAGQVPCPIHEDCECYKKAKAEGKRFRWQVQPEPQPGERPVAEGLASGQLVLL
jgi:hypothetical protein